MKKSVKCYACANCRYCDNKQEDYCIKENYIFFTTEQEKELCDIMCNKEETE